MGVIEVKGEDFGRELAGPKRERTITSACELGRGNIAAMGDDDIL